MDTALIMIGVACIIGAIIGGGMKLQVLEMGKLDSLWRQFLLALFGIGLIGYGLNMRKENEWNSRMMASPQSAPAEAAPAVENAH